MSDFETARDLTDHALGHMTAVLNVCATLVVFHPFRPIVDEALAKLEGVANDSSGEPFKDGFRDAMKHLHRAVSAVEAGAKLRDLPPMDGH